MRHGESVWNLENRFTRWTDVDLSEDGLEEVASAGQLLKGSGLRVRSRVNLGFETSDSNPLDPAGSTQSYGASNRVLLASKRASLWSLQGLNKAETAKKYGDEQVHIWRRSYAIRPPALEKSDPRYRGHEQEYSLVPGAEIPVTESF